MEFAPPLCLENCQKYENKGGKKTDDFIQAAKGQKMGLGKCNIRGGRSGRTPRAVTQTRLLFVSRQYSITPDYIRNE